MESLRIGIELLPILSDNCAITVFILCDNCATILTG